MNCLIDLHLHLDGSLSLKNVKDIAPLANVDISRMTDEEILDKMIAPPGADLTEYLTKFDFSGSLLQNKRSLSKATLNLLNELEDDGLIYAEIRFAPMLHTSLGMSMEEAVEAVIDGAKKARIPSGIILCMMRGFDYNLNKMTIDLAKKYLGHGVVAVDLAGDESRFKTIDYKPLFKYASDLLVPFTVHAGEADGPKSVIDAVESGARRIGHGVRSLEDKNAIDILKKNNIMLEVCPKSNIDTGIYRDIKSFPLKELLDEGLIITINTDDMSVSNVTLKSQYEMMMSQSLVDEKMIKSFLINSARYSFASDILKEKLIEKINKEFKL